jgi:hypothetical protein
VARGTVGDPRGLLEAPLKANFQRIYRHYINQTPIEPEELILLRQAAGMADKFNTYTRTNPRPAGANPGFIVNGGGFQDASEYILKLKTYFEEPPVEFALSRAYRAYRTTVDRAETAYERAPSEENRLAMEAAQEEGARLLRLASPAPFPSIGFLEVNVGDETSNIKDFYDFYLHRVFSGYNRIAENRGIRQRLIQQYNTLTDTFIVFFNRTSFGPEGERIAVDNPVSILKSITIPLVNVPEGHHPDLVTFPLDPAPEPLEIIQARFELDAIVVNIPGHYYSYVKCGDTEEWLRYYAMSAGRLSLSFPSLNALIANYERNEEEDISRRAVLLVYHRVRE